MDITYHYPPELLQLLVDAIPRLCRSKQDVLLFLRGAGVCAATFTDVENTVRTNREAINKFEIVRKILQRLNERGEDALRERREIIRRVVEFEDFSTCWPSDQLKAMGLVAEIRRVVNVKDSFTRMRQEREAERRQKAAQHKEAIEAAQRRRLVMEQIRNDLSSLFCVDSNPSLRGVQLEGVLNRLFACDGILVRESFTRSGQPGEGVIEQVDGVIELEGELYLVEMKWLHHTVGVQDVSQHLVRVFSRGSSRGIFISATEYSPAAIATCKESLARAVIFLCTLEEFVRLLDQQADVKEFMKRKLHSALIDKNPFIKVLPS